MTYKKMEFQRRLTSASSTSNAEAVTIKLIEVALPLDAVNVAWSNAVRKTINSNPLCKHITSSTNFSSSTAGNSLLNILCINGTNVQY